MKVLDYVRDLFAERLRVSECLVVYDPEERYRSAVEALEGESRTVVYGDEGTIEGREAAMEAWRAIGAAPQGTHHLLIYLPIEKPANDRAWQRDPYAPFAQGGDVFPSAASHSYLELCVGAKPNHEEQIRALFEQNGAPDLATVEAVDGGAAWPQLRTVLEVESDREIVRSLLSPTDAQREALKSETGWRSEYVTFTEQVLGVLPASSDASFGELRSELARMVLFSEFVFDLPDEEDLPASLTGVPRADASAAALVRAVCDDLRTSTRHKEEYKTLAGAVAESLNLEAQSQSIQDFGALDTFSFEERAFLEAFVRAVEDRRFAEARRIIGDREMSIWADSEERGSDWILAERLLDLAIMLEGETDEIASIDDSLDAIIEYYVDHGRQVDTLHRMLEQTVQEKHWQVGVLETLVDTVRDMYRTFADRLQAAFIEQVRSEGWSSAQWGKQTEVFDRFVAPSLSAHGHRVAYVMVDAFRYELAADLAKRLPETVDVKDIQVEAVMATPPTTTRVGMASLLPNAEGNLHLSIEKGRIVPRLGDSSVVTPDDRLRHAKNTYGDRCERCDLDTLFREKGASISETTQLLLVTTRGIDTAGESMSSGVERIIHTAQEKYFQAVGVLRELGFREIHFVTDHGFLLLSEQEAGDGVSKPPGTWHVQKERCLVGNGSSSSTAIAFRTDDLGVSSDVNHIAVPQMLGAFRRGSTYMHGGLSLQESVLPVLSVRVEDEASSGKSPIQLHLSYRSKREGWISMRRPMIEIKAEKADMFGAETLEFRLEAHSDSEVVGRATSSNHVDPSTGLVQIDLQDALQSSIKVPLRMREDFHGTFEVIAIDPISQVRFDSITLKTDYVE